MTASVFSSPFPSFLSLVPLIPIAIDTHQFKTTYMYVENRMHVQILESQPN